MAGLKPSVNLFALLDRNDPGDKLVIDLDDGNAKQDTPAVAKHKKTATPPASLTKDLFAQAYPTARDYVIRKNQLERQARARARAEAEAAARAKANIGVSGGDKSVGLRPTAARYRMEQGEADTTTTTTEHRGSSNPACRESLELHRGSYPTCRWTGRPLQKAWRRRQHPSRLLCRRRRA